MIDRVLRVRAAVWRTLRRHNAFVRNCNGTTAIVFAISVVPVMGIVGLALDYGKAYNARAVLQTAVDAAAIAAAATPLNATPNPTAKATSAFNALAQSIPFASQVSISVDSVDDTSTVDVNAQVKTTFMPILGIDSISVSASAAARSPTFNAEVVLVLDYSSSMSGSKYQAMRDGAIELINVVTSELANLEVKIALVPFAREVYASLPGEHVLVTNPGNPGNPGIPGASGTTWTNCTSDRKWPYNTDDSTPTGNIATRWGRTDSNDIIDPSDEYDDCPDYPARNLVVRPLTDDHPGTITQLLNMTPYSGTNTSVGLQMGWQVISPNAPFTEGTEYFGEKTKVVILLSDGRQNKKGWGPDGEHTDEHGIDNTAALCEGIKTKGVIMVTVAYEISDPDGKAALQACATSGEYYVEGDEGTIFEVFKGVGTRLMSKGLHLIR